MIRVLLLAALLALRPLLAAAVEPWLLTFPDLAFDSTHAYFSGPEWTAFYSPLVSSLVTVPRESLAVRGLLPEPVRPTKIARTSEFTFICDGATILCRGPDGRDTMRALPPPTSDAVAYLAAAGAKNVNPAMLEESVGPAFGTDAILWFGLTLRDPESRAVCGGIGWFDPATNMIGRVYVPPPAGYTPQWIGVRDDTVYALFSRKTKGGQVRTRLIAFAPDDQELSEIDLAREGVPGGGAILSMAQWEDTLLIATDRAIAMWRPGRSPESWQTGAWASNRATWLYLKTFPGGDPDKGKAVEFLPLKSNTPTDVKAKVGNWLQVVAPVGIEGYVDPAAWEKRNVLWSQRNWGCGDSLCFARLRVPMKGELVETDFTNTSLTYIDRDANGVKVGFKAAWARMESLAPVAVPLQPPEKGH